MLRGELTLATGRFLATPFGRVFFPEEYPGIMAIEARRL
ncbi:MAG: hypothetical protein JWP50_2091 [Phenylobacterium sp.]|nr:hypothetical protein [Phenylobacterium sp.]